MLPVLFVLYVLSPTVLYVRVGASSFIKGFYHHHVPSLNCFCYELDDGVSAQLSLLPLWLPHCPRLETCHQCLVWSECLSHLGNFRVGQQGVMDTLSHTPTPPPPPHTDLLIFFEYWGPSFKPEEAFQALDQCTLWTLLPSDSPLPHFLAHAYRQLGDKMLVSIYYVTNRDK